MRYVVNPDGLIVDSESGVVIDTVVYEVQELQIDYYNNRH